VTLARKTAFRGKYYPSCKIYVTGALIWKLREYLKLPLTIEGKNKKQLGRKPGG
jgi:hypothetical protein